MHAGLLVCLTCIASLAHAQHTLPTTLQEQPWLPSPSELDTLHQKITALTTFPLTQASEWNAKSCTLDQHTQRYTQCSTITIKDAAGWTLQASEIQWDTSGRPTLITAPVITHKSTLKLSAKTRRGTTYIDVNLSTSHASQHLHVQRMEHQQDTSTWSMNQLTWFTGHAPKESLQQATQATTNQSKNSWTIHHFNNGKLFKRDTLNTTNRTGTRGLLPPTLTALPAREQLFIGQDITPGLHPFFGHALVGLFASPLNSAMVGASMGLTGQPTPQKMQYQPLRASIALHQDDGLIASLTGDFHSTAAEGTPRLDLHLEEGNQALLEYVLPQQQSALRHWQQSRAGVWSGDSTASIQATLIHHQQDDENMWTGQAQGWTTLPLKDDAINLEVMINHRSSQYIKADQTHQSELLPGIIWSTGSQNRMYALAYTGFLFVQNTAQTQDTEGIQTAQQLSAHAEALAGASFEGRFSKVTHELRPEVRTFILPVRWQRERTRSDIQSRSIGGTLKLGQEVAIARRVHVKLPTSLTLLHTGLATDQKGQSNLTMVEPELIISPLDSLTLRSGTLLCRGTYDLCDDGTSPFKDTHVGLSWKDTFQVTYHRSVAQTKTLSARWLTTSHHTGGVTARQWIEMADNTHDVTMRRHEPAHMLGWTMNLRRFSLSGVGFRQASTEGNQWGAHTEATYLVQSTGWRWMLNTTVLRGSKDLVYLGMGWRG